MQLNKKDKQIIEHLIAYCLEVHMALVTFKNNRELFMQSPVFRNACSMPIMQIGELSKNLSEECQNNNKAIPWQAIKGMRNIFAHDYHSMNKEIIWETATQSIPKLSTQLKRILNRDLQNEYSR
jgi:uncharacterized protein with HEPN domain